MKLRLWQIAFYLTHSVHWCVLQIAYRTDWLSARCAFRSIGNTKFKNTCHNFARFETVDTGTRRKA